MIVAPFRSNLPGTDVYHTNTLCPEAKVIESSEQLDGTGDLPECGSCQALTGVRRGPSSTEHALRRDLRIKAEAEVLAGFGVLIWVIDSDEVLLSEGAYEVFGLTPAGALIPADLMTSAVHPDDIAAVRSALTIAAEGGELNLPHRVVKPDRTVHWVRARGRKVAETSDYPEYLLGTVVDITEEVEAS